jgi:hypothetical protein
MMVPCWWRQMHALSAFGAKPSRAVVARGLRHIVLTYEDSSVFRTQQEAKKNYLVTITSTAFSSTPCPVRLFLCQSDPERLPARSAWAEQADPAAARYQRIKALNGWIEQYGVEQGRRIETTGGAVIAS